MGPVSIKDIARAARVSHSTVSRALRNSPLVNRDTADRIWRIAREKNYRASAVARSLVTRKTYTLGVVVTTIADPFIAEVVSGIQEVADARGYSVFLANSNVDPDREIRVVRSFQERRVDGVLVAASRVGALYLPLLSESNVPIVLINNQYPGEFVHSVTIENTGGALAVTRHLVALGHRRIAYIGDQFGFQSESERFGGYRQALEEAALRFIPELTAHGDGKPEAGLRAMKKLVGLRERPTAVFCYNDLTALGALRAARMHGVRVPEDVSIAGFDDLSIASFTEPPLTTVRQPKRRMGRLATEILLKLLAGSGAEANVKVEGKLIVRASTGPAGV